MVLIGITARTADLIGEKCTEIIGKTAALCGLYSGLSKPTRAVAYRIGPFA